MAQPGHRIIQSKLLQVLLGDMGTGKTSLVLRFVKDQFFTHLEPTIGAAFFTQGLSLTDATVKLDIWDTAGQERYHSLVPMYYRGAESAIVVYDISSLDTFDRAKKWVQELQNQSHSQRNPNLVMALVANKSDLEPKKEVDDRVHTLKRLHSLPVYCPDHTDGENFAEENGMLFMRTSAENVNELFYEIAKRLATLHPPKPHGTDLNEARPGGIRKMFCCSG